MLCLTWGFVSQVRFVFTRKAVNMYFVRTSSAFRNCQSLSSSLRVVCIVSVGSDFTAVLYVQQ